MTIDIDIDNMINMARKTETLIRLTPDTKELLKLLAEEYQLSLSETVAKLIENERQTVITEK